MTERKVDQDFEKAGQALDQGIKAYMRAEGIERYPQGFLRFTETTAGMALAADCKRVRINRANNKRIK